MANYYDDNDDLRFYVERGLDWERLVRLTEYDFQSPGGFTSVAEAVSFYKDTLSLVGQFVADEIGAHALVLDKQHPKLVDGEVAYPKDERGRIARADLHRLYLSRPRFDTRRGTSHHCQITAQ